jgi:UDP-N-acetyl-2-amino-2-deoxyglucuronate dehydrogenase
MATPIRNFAMTGVSGFVAPRHLQAIAAAGHALVAATDPHDAAGVLDRYAFGAKFFTDFDEFERDVRKRQRERDERRVHAK